MKVAASWPSLRQLGLAAAVVVVAGIPVELAWWLFDPTIANSVYRGMTFMLVAITHVTVTRQVILGLLVGVAAIVGYLVTNTLPVLIAAVVVACLAQAVFNTWSIGAGALLPTAVLAYGNAAPVQRPLGVAAAALAGAAIAILAALLARRKVAETPARSSVAVRHAATLAIGCTLLILLNEAVGLPHGSWAVLTFCLVYLPDPEQTVVKVQERMIGTVVGAVVAAAIASQAPRVVCLVLAVPCAILAVAFALLPGHNLGFVVFLTPTIILLYAASKSGWDVVGLAGERVGLTVAAGLLAIALTAIVLRPRRARSSQA